jgi:hypothetical protein
MAGAVVAVASLAQIGLLSADIVLNETDGEAYYPDIKKFKDELEKLNTEVEELKPTYEQAYAKLVALKNETTTIATQNEAIYVKLDRISLVSKQVREKISIVSDNFPGKEKDLVNVNFETTVLDEIVKYTNYGMQGFGLTYQARSIGRAFYSRETILKAWRAEIGNRLHGTNETTSRLRLMKVSKVATAMALFGIATAVYGLVRGLQGAKAKRDALEDAVVEARKTKEKLIDDTETININIEKLNGYIEKSITLYYDSFRPMIDDLNSAYDQLVKKNPGVTVEREIPEELIQADADIQAIRKMELASGEQLKLITDSQLKFLCLLEKTQKDFKAARKEITIMGVIAPLALANVGLSIILVAIQSIDPDITESKICIIIKEKLGIENYNSP